MSVDWQPQRLRSTPRNPSDAGSAEYQILRPRFTPQNPSEAGSADYQVLRPRFTPQNPSESGTRTPPAGLVSASPPAFPQPSLSPAVYTGRQTFTSRVPPPELRRVTTLSADEVNDPPRQGVRRGPRSRSMQSPSYESSELRWPRKARGGYSAALSGPSPSEYPHIVKLTPAEVAGASDPPQIYSRKVHHANSDFTVRSAALYSVEDRVPCHFSKRRSQSAAATGETVRERTGKLQGKVVHTDPISHRASQDARPVIMMYGYPQDTLIPHWQKKLAGNYPQNRVSDPLVYVDPQVAKSMGLAGDPIPSTRLSRTRRHAQNPTYGLQGFPFTGASEAPRGLRTYSVGSNLSAATMAHQTETPRTAPSTASKAEAQQRYNHALKQCLADSAAFRAMARCYRDRDRQSSLALKEGLYEVKVQNTPADVSAAPRTPRS
eukprot:RCo039033